MKFNVEVECDWLREDQTIEEGVLKAVAERVAKSVGKDALEQIARKAASMMEAQLSALFDDLLTQDIIPRNMWGEPLGPGVPIKEQVRKRLESFLDERVDISGYKVDRGDKTRLQYTIDERIKKATDALAQQLTKDTDAKIKAALSESLKAKLGEQIAKNIDWGLVFGK